MSRKKGVSYWKKKAWSEFSKFIRLRDTNKLGCECYTCGKYYPMKVMQAGHFQPGRHKVFLFDERQVHAQCFRCNINLKGNWPEYYKRMENDYGVGEVDEMIKSKRKLQQWKAYELEEIYKKYKMKNQFNLINNYEK